MRKRYFLTMGFVVLLTALVTFSAWAAPPQVNYQGQLLDESTGDPHNGLFDMEFRIYNASSGGSLLWSESHSDVEVSEGVFNVILGSVNPLDPNDFLDDDRWIELRVEGEVFSPRQQCTSVLFAINADLLDGMDSGDFAGSGHHHDSQYVNEGQANSVSSGMITDSAISAADLGANSVGASEIIDNTVGTNEVANNSLTASDLAPDSVGNSELGPNSVGSAEIINGAVTAADMQDGAARAEILDDDGPGSSLNADYLDNYNSTYFMPATTDNWVNETGDTMTGALNMSTTGTSITVDANTTNASVYGVYVDADQSAANNHSIFGFFTDTDSDAATAYTYGTYSNAAGNSYSYGVYGIGSSDIRSAYGLFGSASLPTGNTYQSYGVWANANTYGTGTVYGAYDRAYHYGTSGTSYGTYSYTSGSDTGSGYGIYSYAFKSSSDTGGTAFGGYFTGDNDYSAGSSYGISTRAIGTGGTNYGIYATASGGTTNYAGYFDGTVRVDGKAEFFDTTDDSTVLIEANDGGSSPGGAIALENGNNIVTVELDGYYWQGGSLTLRNKSGTSTIQLQGDYGNTGDGRIITNELQITGGSDLSEQFDIEKIDEDIKPGMLVSIDPERPGKLLISTASYDNKVAGIISGAGGIKPGMLMGQAGTKADGAHPVALTGRVYCWADATNGPIKAGDLLTTSNTPGHAMKATNRDRAFGATIGKAMTSLEEGKGLILVLVSLQ